jgi:hypothetical protein
LVADVVRAREQERERLINIARGCVEVLSKRVPVLAAAVAGSVARGDFNVWSDIDLIVVVKNLPARLPERSALFAAVAPPGVQTIGFTSEEFESAVSKKNPIALEVLSEGVILKGEEFFSRVRAALHLA